MLLNFVHRVIQFRMDKNLDSIRNLEDWEITLFFFIFENCCLLEKKVIRC